MPHQTSFSHRFGRIQNAFATRLYCDTCDGDRLMMISVIDAGVPARRDSVVYQCTDCGTENTEIAIPCVAPTTARRR